MSDLRPDSRATLDDWLAWLQTLSPTEIELGLDRVSNVLQRLNLCRPELVLTIGGTNGKGSSVSMLSGLLRKSGLVVGAYTSPHVLHYGERIRINGEVTTDAQLIESFLAVDAARENTRLTYFEFGTLAALHVFAAHSVDAMVLEVGLGGRLDAVNAVDPNASLITNVSLDHCAWLGNDVEAIAVEKAGIMRRGVPTVFASDDVPQAIVATAEQSGADLWLRGRDFAVEMVGNDRFRWTGREHVRAGLRHPALVGEHQIDNAAGVLALLDAVGLLPHLDSPAINAVLGQVVLAGRMQRVDAGGRRFLLDGAHNPAGAAALARELPALAAGGRVHAIVGMLDDKDIEGIVRALAPRVHTWFAARAESPRALPPEVLAEQIGALSARSCQLAASVPVALAAAAAEAGPDDLVVVAGSFFAVAPALRWLADSDIRT